MQKNHKNKQKLNKKNSNNNTGKQIKKNKKQNHHDKNYFEFILLTSEDNIIKYDNQLKRKNLMDSISKSDMSTYW